MGKAFASALKTVGGKVDGCGSGRQTDLRRLWDAAGWAGYIAKDFDRTAEALGTDKIVYQCNATIAGAREEYEASLARQKAHRKTQGRPVGAKRVVASLTHSPATETRLRPSVSQSTIPGPVNQLLLIKPLKNNEKIRLFRFTRFHEYAMNSAANIILLEHINHMPQFILDAATYSRLMDALLAVSADAYVSQDADPFKIALGEIAGIWSESTLPDCRTEKFLEAA